MSADEHVRAAADRVIRRERARLGEHFVPAVAAALGRYFAETVERGLPSDGARRELADLLAPHGLADPEGHSRHSAALAGAAALQIAGTGIRNARELEEEYRRADLRSLGIGLDVFRSEFHRRARMSPRPVAIHEVSAALVREHYVDGLSQPPSSSLRLLRSAGRVIRRGGRFRRQRAS